MLRQYKINVVNLKDRLVLSGHERVNQRGRERGIERKREERQTNVYVKHIELDRVRERRLDPKPATSQEP